MLLLVSSFIRFISSFVSWQAQPFDDIVVLLAWNAKLTTFCIISYLLCTHIDLVNSWKHNWGVFTAQLLHGTRQDEYAISTTRPTPMISVSSNPTKLLRILFHQTGRENSQDGGHQSVLVYPLVDKIGTRFQPLHLCWRGPASFGTTGNAFPPNRKYSYFSLQTRYKRDVNGYTYAHETSGINWYPRQIPCQPKKFRKKCALGA